jgi:ribose 5-phosphate isomerase B
MKIALGADHAGAEAKDRLVRLLSEAGHEVEDCGADGTSSVDYPDFAVAVARRVADGDVERGILVCGTGIGMSIAANKVAGVRAAKCNDPSEAQLSRAHNDANVLCLGARVLDATVLAEVAQTFIDSPFEGGRHARRVDKMMDTETSRSG